jgi:hypothetical protein
MSSSSYASIVIVEFLSAEVIVVEKISVTLNSCDLSGAWKIEEGNYTLLNQIIQNSFIIVVGNKSFAQDFMNSHSVIQLQIQDFLVEAKRDAIRAIEFYEEYMIQNDKEYAAYMSIRPVERKLLPKVSKKKLVKPEFYDWPDFVDIDEAESFLYSKGIKREFSGSDLSFRKILASANLVKLFIDKWRMDEVERSNRLYLLGKEASISLLPLIWLQHLK